VLSLKFELSFEWLKSLGLYRKHLCFALTFLLCFFKNLLQDETRTMAARILFGHVSPPGIDLAILNVPSGTSRGSIVDLSARGSRTLAKLPPTSALAYSSEAPTTVPPSRPQPTNAALYSSTVLLVLHPQWAWAGPKASAARPRTKLVVSGRLDL
jgi:hypothetical protein